MGIRLTAPPSAKVQPTGCTYYTQPYGCASRRCPMQVEREIVFPVEPDELWEALTNPERLEEWFANDVELDAREGGAGIFRWENGEERHATVREVVPGEKLVLDWDDEGAVEFDLEQVPDGTRLVVRETSPDFSTALELRAMALAWAAA